MALNIKSEEAHRLAKRLAESRGATLTDAVTAALRESLRTSPDPVAGVDTLLAEVRQVPRESLWRARNEIYLRRGYIFPNVEGQQFASEFGGSYHPVSPSIEAIQAQLTPVEITNLQLIATCE